MPRLAETSSSTTRTTGVRDDDDARGWPEFVNGDIVVVGKRVKIPRIFIKGARGDGVTKDMGGVLLLSFFSPFALRMQRQLHSIELHVWRNRIRPIVDRNHPLSQPLIALMGERSGEERIVKVQSQPPSS